MLKNESMAHLAFLDVEKVIDTVWHNGLFHNYKLFHFGIRGCTWRLLKQWYSSSSCCVLWKGQLSCSISQGIKLGAILSPLLYSMSVDDLLVALENSSLGICIGDHYCDAPMYADDLTLAATAPVELQAMLNMVAHYMTLSTEPFK